MSSGALSKAVVQKNGKTTAWGQQPTTFDAASSQAVPLLNENVLPSIERDEAPIIAGKAGLSEGEVVAASVAGDISTAIMYNDLDLLFCMALGFEHPDESPEADGSQYRHVFEMDDRLERRGWQLDEGWALDSGMSLDHQKVRGFGFAVDKTVSDHAADECMVQTLALNLGIPESSLTFTVNGWKSRSGSYTHGGWPALTDVRRAVFPQATVELGSVDGTTYPDAEIGISSLTITLSNNLAIDDRSTEGGAYILEPLRNGFAEVSGEITLPRYTSDDILDRFDAQTTMRLCVKLVNGNYECNFYLPRIVFSAATVTTPGPEMRQPTYSFRAFKPHDLTADENAFRAGGEWVTDLGSISMIKNNPLTIITVSDEDSNILTAS